MNAGGRQHAGKDPTGLAKAVVIGLYCELAILVLMAVVAVKDLSGFGSSMEPFQDASLIRTVLQILIVTIVLATSVLILKWIYRSTLNAHALADGLTVSPGWSIAWFFIPIAYFWMPFRAVREAWQVGIDPTSWRSVPTPVLLRWWWGLWLLAGALETAPSSVPRTGRMGFLVAGFDLAAALIGAALILVFIKVVRTLSARQAQSLARNASA